ncbi:GIY-YIG nuclease family protein [Bdellovibrio bacteriovorus]|uniref:DUF4357 domain-containing protein n=1 Tax=Bdellovibrio bacteriovorus str. Tiberius TaxID=1069642 RepID=K7YQY9_BDEBC|nr:GIY-YIG nuclease family protein [Bdellovibrio bacteriovorus]AFX99937.1 hypothetical protein Bdt_0229 [Bdellovibrio bacteriovorus str. Tiberius]
MNIIGKTLKIYVRGLNARSLKSIEIVNWTGKAFMGNRSHLKQMRDISELEETGIYLLLHDDEDSDLTKIYIGETDSSSKRIIQHAKKDWWENFIVFVSRDLTKAHVRYLEERLVRLAKLSVSSLKVMNEDMPSGSKLPEPDVCAMEEFLANMIFVLETLGFGLFLTEKRMDDPIQYTGDAPTYYLTLPKDLSDDGENQKALMHVTDGSFVLKAGSPIRKSARDSFKSHSYFGLWQQITNSKAVRPSQNPNFLETTQDMEFKSPSAAAAVVRGGQTNGRTDWKRVSDGKPLFECELEEAA